MIVWCKRCDTPMEYDTHGDGRGLKWPHYKSTYDRPMCGLCDPNGFGAVMSRPWHPNRDKGQPW